MVLDLVCHHLDPSWTQLFCPIAVYTNFTSFGLDSTQPPRPAFSFFYRGLCQFLKAAKCPHGGVFANITSRSLSLGTRKCSEGANYSFLRLLSSRPNV